MTILLVVVAIAVVVGVSLFAVGPSVRSPDETPDREPVDLPTTRPVSGDDVDRVRFALGFRGYRMDQVDAVLDRAAADLRLRDEHIDSLQRALIDAGVPLPEVPVAATADDDASSDSSADGSPEVADPARDEHAEGHA